MNDRRFDRPLHDGFGVGVGVSVGVGFGISVGVGFGVCVGVNVINATVSVRGNVGASANVSVRGSVGVNANANVNPSVNVNASLSVDRRIECAVRMPCFKRNCGRSFNLLRVDCALRRAIMLSLSRG